MTDAEVLPRDLAAPDDGPHLASWTRRVVAALLDGAVLTGATWIVLGNDGIAPSLTPTFGVSQTDAVDPVAWSTSPWLVGTVLVMLALQGWTGATPGKRLAGVAIVRLTDGRPVGVIASGLRVVAHVLDAILVIGYLRPLWNERKQTFADSVVGTLALQTRAPLAHPWLVRLEREPSAFGSTVVTMAALTVCVLGVGFSTGSSSWGGSWERSVPCDDDRTLVPRTADADVVRRGDSLHESRLWVRGVAQESIDQDLRISWRWTSPEGRGDALFETDVVRADGSTIEITEEAVLTGDLSGVAVFQAATVPASDLHAAGAGWTLTTRLVVDGMVVGACTVDNADWDAAALPATSRG